MTYRGGVITGVLFTLVVGGAAWWFLAAPPAGAGKSAPPAVPATVAKPAKEEQFNTVVLSPEAEARLAIRTEPAARKPMPRTRVYGGQVIAPAGKTIIVSAPLNGTLQAPPAGVPEPGRTVKAGQPVFRLLPLLTPEGRANLASARVDAEGQVENARTQLDAARIALDRAAKLLRDEAGSRRMVDEARAAFDLAEKTFQAATARRDLLVSVTGEVEKGTAGPVAVDAPADGLLRAVSARPGQVVPAGAALFEVVNLDAVWVRVPVYVGDLPGLDAEKPAAVGNLAAPPGDPGRPANPVAAPPSADPLAGTVDLFYGLDNRAARYSPGERVGVTVPLKGEAESLTVPWAAVLHDVYGNTWVYERTAERTYIRRRVGVRYVVSGTAVLADGPAVGAAVVVAGAAELFGTETGFSK